MSSGHNEPPVRRTDYVHIEELFQAIVSATIQQNATLDDAIRQLFVQGYGKLLICRGLKGRTAEEPTALKRRVITVVNELIAARPKEDKSIKPT